MYKYDEVFTYENVLDSAKLCKKGKSWKNNTCLFTDNIYENARNLHIDLTEGTYALSDYFTFKIYEPKERTIKSIKFKDKVVQRVLCDKVLTPITESKLIYDNFACRKGKGTHAAIKRVKQFMRRAYFENENNYWVLKCDIEKYFDSIDHTLLIDMINLFDLDDRIKTMLIDIVLSTGGGKGLPLGNQTSQIFSLYFLDGLDKMIKRKLKIKFYLRYMDDFVLFSHNKEYLQHCKREIEKFLDTLNLKLNNKSHIFPIKNGFDFLGFHFYSTASGKIIMKLRRASKERMRRKLKKFNELKLIGRMTKAEVLQSWNSWQGHAKHGNTYFLIKDMKNKSLLRILKEENKDG